MRYEIVLVSFLFDDLSGTKVRPALCLTEQIGRYQHIVIAFITSQTTKADEVSDILIEESADYFKDTGLKVRSAVRLHRLTAMPVRLIKRKLGILPTGVQKSVATKLRQLFEL